MRRAKRAIAIVTFTLVSSCTNQALPVATPTSQSSVLHLYSTTATVPLARDLSAAYNDANNGITFDINTSNYQTMVDQLDDGNLSYFLSNHLPADSPLWAAPIGQDGISMIVHPNNPVSELSTTQLRSIYEGRITNWQDLGGDDSAIQVITRESGSGTRREFEALVMGNRRTVLSAQIAPSTSAMLTSVANLENSIGYVSMSHLDDSVRPVPIDSVLPTPETVYDNTYPLRSTLFVVGKGEPTGDYRLFVAWIQSQDGQAVVGRRYAPLLRP